MEKTQQPQKPSESAESADLDAALEEKFQQVEEDLDHFRTLNDTPIADAKPAASKEPAEEAPAEETCGGRCRKKHSPAVPAQKKHRNRSETAWSARHATSSAGRCSLPHALGRSCAHSR